MTRLLTYIALLIAAILPANARSYSPEEMPNVNIDNKYQFVSDPEGLLNEATKTSVNSMLYNLRQNTTAEVAVAIVPDTGDLTIEEWGEEVFQRWGLGTKDRDNGVLLIIAPDMKLARVQTGYGTEGIVTDAWASDLVRNTIAPAMKEGNLNAAVSGAVTELTAKMSTPDAAAELRSERSREESSAIDANYFYTALLFVAATGFILCAFVFFRNLLSPRRRKASRYDRARMWRADLNPLIILTIVSAGSGAIFLLLAFIIYRRLRTKPMRCPVCDAKMHRLPEDKDNELLSDSQDLEERLKTVDYDVWECPKCGAVERLRFRYPQKKYTECPACHTVAYCQVADFVKLQPTTRNAGMGEKVYECKYCHHQNRVPYVIPKKTDETAALAAGAVIGSALGRGGGFGGGGGSIGGGFGGGSTGGGGATGGW